MSVVTPTSKIFSPNEPVKSITKWIKPVQYKEERDTFWYLSKSERPPRNFTPGVFQIMTYVHPDSNGNQGSYLSSRELFRPRMPRGTRVVRHSATKERYISHGNHGMRHGDAGEFVHIRFHRADLICIPLLVPKRYRNFEMVCTALMDQPFQPLYFPLLDSPIPPSVRNLQKWIEQAWEAGTTMFDDQHCGLICPLFQDSIPKEPNS